MNKSLSNFKAVILLFLYSFVSALLAMGLILIVENVFNTHTAIDSQWLKYIYAAIQTITIFGLPVLLFRAFNEKIEISLFPQKGFYKILGIGIAAWLLCFFPVNALFALNKSVHFPEFMSGIEQNLRYIQNQSEAYINDLMSYRGYGHFFTIILVIGVIPSIFEELFFRGLVQQLVFKIFGTVWPTIIITSIIFSVFHFEFYAFLPRVLLGILLSVAFFSTGKLWLPIFLHFINNVFSILVHQFMPQQLDNLSEIGISGFQWAISLLSFVLLLYVFKFMLKERSFR